MPWVWQDDGAGAGAATGYQPGFAPGQQWPSAGSPTDVWGGMGISGMPWDQPWMGEMSPGMNQGQQGYNMMNWLSTLGLPMTQLQMENTQNQMQFGEGQRRFNAEQAAKEQQQYFEQNVRWPQEQALHRGLANTNIWGGWNAPNARYL